MNEATRQMRIASGQCTHCEKPSRPDRVVCQSCADAEAVTRKNRKMQRIAANICVDCGLIPPRPNLQRCQLCTAKNSESHRTNRARIRRIVFQAYGGQCACPKCPERTTDLRFLMIDHINNDGAKHRRQLRGTKSLTNFNLGSMHIFMWLHRQFKTYGKWPAGFQILCGTCNHGKAMNKGVCPHAEAKQDSTGQASFRCRLSSCH